MTFMSSLEDIRKVATYFILKLATFFGIKCSGSFRNSQSCWTVLGVDGIDF